MNNVIGIDIGGTKISFACVQDGIIKNEVLPYKTPETSQEIVDTLFEGIEQIIENVPSQAVGIATAGSVNLENSKVTGSTGNLPDGYSKLELKNIIEEKFQLKTLIENDANAAAYAEYKVGAAKEHSNTIMVTLGTGIGGGIILAGNLLKGSTGAAAEIGHIPITYEKKRKCTCGDWDCWEAFASGTGYAQNAREMASTLPHNITAEFLQGRKPESITTYDVIQGLEQKNKFATKVHKQWEEYILIGLISLSNIFDPESIVLSGGMAEFVNFNELEKELHQRTVISKPVLLPAQAGNNAGLIGSALLAANKFL